VRKLFLLILAFSFLSLENSSDIPNRYFGSYKGVAPKSTLAINGETTTVKETIIRLILSDKKLVLTIGNSSFDGTYDVTAVTKSYYSLTASFDEPLGKSILLVSKKDKKVTWKRYSSEAEIILLKE
jgi:hypothetical protein